MRLTVYSELVSNSPSLTYSATMSHHSSGRPLCSCLRDMMSHSMAQWHTVPTHSHRFSTHHVTHIAQPRVPKVRVLRISAQRAQKQAQRASVHSFLEQLIRLSHYPSSRTLPTNP